MRHLWAIPVIAVALLGCSTAATPSAPSVSAPAAASVADPPSGSEPANAVIVEDGGLRLVAGFDRMEVEAGGTVTIDLSIENTRSTDVVFSEPCGPTAMTIAVRVPVEPTGRAWEGIAGKFKTYALEQSAGMPMESSIRVPLMTSATTLPCHAATRGMGPSGSPWSIIEAGTTYETVLTWPAEIVHGVPALPGDAPFAMEVLYDLEATANGMVKAEVLEATGTISVRDGAASAISAGQALDATIADPAFMAWLMEQPEGSWVNANLFLQPAAIGVDVLPVVPYWDVELFREPRNFAIFYVDAMTGEVLRQNFCEIPCDR